MGYVLNEAGMAYRNVVTCHTYLADMGNYQTMNKVYGSYFEAGSYLSAYNARDAGTTRWG